MKKMIYIRIFVLLFIICSLCLSVSMHFYDNHPDAVSSRAMLV